MSPWEDSSLINLALYLIDRCLKLIISELLSTNYLRVLAATRTSVALLSLQFTHQLLHLFEGSGALLHQSDEVYVSSGFSVCCEHAGCFLEG